MREARSQYFLGICIFGVNPHLRCADGSKLIDNVVVAVYGSHGFFDIDFVDLGASVRPC